MLTGLVQWLVITLSLLIIAKLLPGVDIVNLGTALIAALVIGLINVFIRPILMLLTLPINLLTLGLFAFMVNALLFGLTARIVPGFEVDSFWSALLGSILLSLITAFLGNMTHRIPRPL